jgi:hypothetical protein
MLDWLLQDIALWPNVSSLEQCGYPVAMTATPSTDHGYTGANFATSTQGKNTMRANISPMKRQQEPIRLHVDDRANNHVDAVYKFPLAYNH